MKSTLAICLFTISALLVPVAGYSADTDNHESAKTFVKDSVITTKIKAKFAKDKGVSAMHIKVDTDSAGVVQLSGKAKSQAEIDRAVELAKSVEGVTSVDNRITLDMAH
ncbi:transporter [Novimethylophilus kurashikiensis]|uniref:Osmotically-inducible protein Y n=1 Tax=Novimethylophilus kurashikiensis TaxID=1825523 RepID=A0A2R5FEM9_9PROT|nr:BON domain-containing protein [Novimethylophilus kurashikiensis]GBG14951.1 transporter [Novimethylophilus kurashikiensis]